MVSWQSSDLIDLGLTIGRNKGTLDDRVDQLALATRLATDGNLGSCSRLNHRQDFLALHIVDKPSS